MTEATSAGRIPHFGLHDRMRLVLRDRGISVGAMAEYLDVARETVSSWINGHVRPSTQTLRLWALRTGVPYEWLVTGEVPVPPDGGTACPQQDSNLRHMVYSTVSSLADYRRSILRRQRPSELRPASRARRKSDIVCGIVATA
jgi:transcriptional regulator with XRE-family HTH domain